MKKITYGRRLAKLVAKKLNGVIVETKYRKGEIQFLSYEDDLINNQSENSYIYFQIVLKSFGKESPNSYLKVNEGYLYRENFIIDTYLLDNDNFDKLNLTVCGREDLSYPEAFRVVERNIGDEVLETI